MFTPLDVGPLLLTWFNFNTLAWVNTHIHSEEWGEIIHPFPNFNGGTIGVWEWISNFITLFIMDVLTYVCCELNRLSQMGHCCVTID